MNQNPEVIANNSKATNSKTNEEVITKYWLNTYNSVFNFFVAKDVKKDEGKFLPSGFPIESYLQGVEYEMKLFKSKRTAEELSSSEYYDNLVIRRYFFSYALKLAKQMEEGELPYGTLLDIDTVKKCPNETIKAKLLPIFEKTVKTFNFFSFD